MGKKMKLIPFFSYKHDTNTVTTPISTRSTDPAAAAAAIANTLISTPPASPLPWQWATCGNINTLSFRDKEDGEDGVFRMVNSAVEVTCSCNDSPCSSAGGALSSSLLCVEEDGDGEESISRRSFCSTIAEEGGPDSLSLSDGDDDRVAAVEMVIKGLKSERLFFEPVGETNSILDEKSIDNHRNSLFSSNNPVDNHRNSLSSSTNPIDITTTTDNNVDKPHHAEETTAMAVIPYKESLILSLESNNPYIDFRKSMSEMVEAHGVKDWEEMEELLAWYLKVNSKTNHSYIVNAFVDLLIDLTSLSSSISRQLTKNDNNKDNSNMMMMNSSTSTSSVSANCSGSGSSSSFSLCHYSSPSPSSSSPLYFPCSPLRSGSAAVAVRSSGGGRLSCSLLDSSEADSNCEINCRISS